METQIIHLCELLFLKIVINKVKYNFRILNKEKAMENIKEELKTLKVDVTEKVLVIDEVEYMCKSSNKTKLEVKKDFINDAIEKATLKEIVIHLTNKVLDSDEFFVKQKVVALINLLKSVRDKVENKKDIYSLNLVVRNLNSYHATQKSEIMIRKDERDFIVNTLVLLAFSSAFNNILKNLYVK